MKHQISSIQSYSVPVYNEVSYSNAETIPIKSVFNSVQLPHAVNAVHPESTNRRESERALQHVFSSACAYSFGEALMSANACLEAPYTTPAEVPVEMVDSPMLPDSAVNVGNTPSTVYFSPITEKHFEEWILYNQHCSHLSEQAVLPDTDVNALWTMLNSVHASKEGADHKAEEFAQKNNIDPLAWSVIVVFNGQSATFLPRENHQVMSKANKSENYNSITNLDVRAWQLCVAGSPGRMPLAVFARNHRLNPGTLRKIVDIDGNLTPLRGYCGHLRRAAKQIFIAPELLGLSPSFYERISAALLVQWRTTMNIHDYGIVSYLSRLMPLRLEEAVRCWRFKQEMHKKTGAVLIASDFAKTYNFPVDDWEKIVANIENWDRASAFDHLAFAMEQFASDYRLDSLAWRFLAWSNELARLMQSRASVHQIQEIQQIQLKLREELNVRLEKEFDRSRMTRESGISSQHVPPPVAY